MPACLAYSPLSSHMIRLGHNHVYMVYTLYTLFLAGNLPNIRSCTVCIYGSGQPNTWEIVCACAHPATASLLAPQNDPHKTQRFTLCLLDAKTHLPTLDASTCAHTCTHINVHTHTHAQTYIHTHKRTHTRTHTYTHSTRPHLSPRLLQHPPLPPQSYLFHRRPSSPRRFFCSCPCFSYCCSRPPCGLWTCPQSRLQVSGRQGCVCLHVQTRGCKLGLLGLLTCMCVFWVGLARTIYIHRLRV
jgi:hypothetical protein